MTEKQENDSKSSDSRASTFITLGAGFGVALGAGVGTALGEVAIGAGIGTALGVAVGAILIMIRGGNTE